MPAANSWLELSRARLENNLAGVLALVGECRIMPVVKANAYGAGAGPIAEVLAANGIEMFAVANVREGVELRGHGIGGRIVVLTYFTRDEVQAIRAHALTPAVFTLDALPRLVADGPTDETLEVWVKVDTGLNRIGVPYSEAADFIRAVASNPGLRVAGVFSTIAENPLRDATQVERLRAVRLQLSSPLRNVPFSLASSHGIVSLPDSYFDIVRPGIMLLGFEPSDRERMNMRLVEQAQLQPIVTWKARIGYRKIVPRGEQVGYGVQPALERDMPIVTVAVGWADGCPPLLSKGGHVLIRGCRCPVLSVSANSTLVDATHAPDAELGEEVVLLGRQGDEEITPYELAQATGSVYRILATIPHEVPRIMTDRRVYS
jgi:alanine racemase